MNLLSYFPMLLGDGITTLHKFNLLLMKNQDYLSFKNVFFPLRCCPMNKFFSTICLDSIYVHSLQFSCSVVSDSATPWITARQASLSITNSRSSLRLTSIESVMPSSHLMLCRPLLLLPPIPPSISLFQWVNSSHEVVKVLEFQL